MELNIANAAHPFAGLSLEFLGTIQEPRQFYVEREEDRRLRAALLASEWVEVYGQRLIGKSSLVRHVFGGLGNGTRVSYVIDVHRWLNVATPRDWSLDLARQLAEDFGVAVAPVQGAVAAARGSGPGRWLSELFRALRQQAGPGRLVVALDEVDRLFSNETGNIHMARPEFGTYLADAFRALISEKPTDIAVVFIGLNRFSSLVYAHASSNTGVGLPLEVRDISEDDWLAGLRTALPAGQPFPEQLARGIWRLTGGQPRLGQELIALARSDKHYALTGDDVAALEKAWLDAQCTVTEAQDCREEEIKLKHSPESSVVKNIRDMWEAELRTAGVALNDKLYAYQQIRRGDYTSTGKPPSEIKFLLNTGLVRFKDRGTVEKLEVKAPLLERVFSPSWVDGLRYRLRPPKRIAAPHEKRLLIINTGGTIGMFYDADRNEVRATPEQFRQQYDKVFNDFPADFEEPFSLDSINVHPQDWSRLARLIYDRRLDYGGFVVAHGTDTMTYTASALAFALGPRLNKPVVFTGAQATVDVTHGDALTNLYRACLVAQKDIPEVVIAFGNHVFRACRAQKMDEKRFEAFESPAYPALAVISEYVELRTKYLRELKKVDIGEDWGLREDFSRDVLVIQLSPGMGVHYFDAALEVENPDTGKKCEGIIIRTLGSGNIPTAPLDYAAFIRRAVARGIPVLISSQYPWHPETHERFVPGAAGAQAGAILVPTMTPAAAETKFRWALVELGKLDEPITNAEERSRWVRVMMQSNIVDEIDADLQLSSRHAPSHSNRTNP